jgi:hypothetical protein
MLHRYHKELRRALAWIVALLAVGAAAAQTFTGVYAGESPNGPVELELEHRGEDLVGVLLAAGARFDLEGYVGGGVGFGYVFDAQGYLGFEAYLQGDTLGLYVFQVDDVGDPIADSVIELILTRRATGDQPGQSAPLASAPAPDPFAPPDPFATPPTAAAADPLVGIFADERLTLTIDPAGPDGYRGVIFTNGIEFALDVHASREGLVGGFESGGQAYTFDAVLEGDVMVFRTAGNVYRLARVVAAGPVDPFAAPAAAPAAAPGSAAASSSPVIARGAHGELREDDALAFIEALEFVLEQVGYAYRFSDAERTEILTSIAQSYPLGSETDQVVLAQARQIWRNVQANWARSSAEEQREFALGVLVLAFGEQTVRQWVGPGSGGGRALGGGGSCTTFEDCTSSFVDEKTWTDTFRSQGCWGAAGCSGYDASTGTLTFDSYE